MAAKGSTPSVRRSNVRTEALSPSTATSDSSTGAMIERWLRAANRMSIVPPARARAHTHVALRQDSTPLEVRLLPGPRSDALARRLVVHRQDRDQDPRKRLGPVWAVSG